MKISRFNVTLRNLNLSLCTLIAAVSLFTACVTVNVNFPESAVQKASDDYVRDLYRTKEQGKSGSPKTSASPTANTTYNFNPFLSTADAAEPTFNLSSPKLDALKGKMKALVPEVIAQKKGGVLGETNDGKLVIHDASKLKPLLKTKVESLVREDNQNRDTLYSEVIQSNHLPSDSLPAVRKSFARSFQAESPSGTWVQTVEGAWSQKP